MPSPLSDFVAFQGVLRDWANRGDWSDDLVTSFIRSAEEKLNAELRIDRMITTTVALIPGSCAPLPDDWLQMDFVQQLGGTKYWPLHYMPRDDFARSNTADTTAYYTIEGREMQVGGIPDAIVGRSIKISYYQEVPVFTTDVTSWVYTKYPSLYRCAALMHADLHAVGEEDKAGEQKSLAEDMIQKLNAQHRYARASGSRLARARMRSFG